MTKLAIRADLDALRAQLTASFDPDKRRIYVCMGTGCKACGGDEILAGFDKALKRAKLHDHVEVVMTGCRGFCENGALVAVRPPGTLYCRVSPADITDIVNKTVARGEVIERLLYEMPGTLPGVPGRRISAEEAIPFYQHQMRLVLGLNDRIDPTRIEDYIREGGYQGLAKALFDMNPDQIVGEVQRSGLRGRGGGGFPTGQKWKFCRAAPGDVKYVICNADEGDPGAFMDRSLLEGNPHAVLEGMAIGALAIGSSHGYVYIRAEYPLAIERLRIAIDQMRECGLLGENILGSDFSFDIIIKEGAGAFVCGEETALIASIEGRRGMPMARPPFPAIKGLFGKPTNINNVETWGNISHIITDGADAYAARGTERSKGTKIFSLVGKVNNTGLVEVPMGMPLRQLVYEIGGGVKGGRALKAVQSGGPSGGCIPAHMMHLPIDYESLAQAGSIMGSGGLVVMDDTTCMVDLARYFVRFTENESCGKCAPCRLGTRQMRMILDDICEGRGTEQSIAQLESLGDAVCKGSLCGLGQTAPNPVLTTIRYFRDEYLAHVREKRCPAGVCQPLFVATCSNGCPSEVDIPAYLSLVAEGREEEALLSHMDRNPFPSVCARVCPHPCEQHCRRETIDAPVAIRSVKRFMVDSSPQVSIPVMERPSEERRRTAVIGAGPAGLTAAYFLRRLGHEVTVYEQMAEPGGMLRYGIPSYRLPHEELKRDIERITSMGVKIECGAAIGKKLSIARLRKDYDAVFVGSGAWSDVTMGVPGEQAHGVASGIEFLKNAAKGPVARLSGEAIVVGGGNTAIDAARTALRLGAGRVTVAYRRTREEMPVQPEEIAEALEEGVQFEFLVAPVEVIADSGGAAAALKFQRMRMGDFDDSGRRRPVPIEGEYIEISASTIIRAIGQKPLVPAGGPPVSKRGTVSVDLYSLATEYDGVFAGGDAVLGPATAVEAIAHGRRAAEAIEHYLHPGKAIHFPWNGPRKLDTAFDPAAPASPAPRYKVHKLVALQRRANFDEVELALSAANARREAGRCLRCDFGKTIVSREEE
ncbi:MAG: NADH-ubiquinone oxidoreductase-F iron-sulfur binding region domain-containing protein [Burkholderiales bacterium]|nr:NADH-ubiquinone oxidoreductase-F iron-sulfur binding region domain-containing protein [Burkholderiales bacterium]